MWWFFCLILRVIMGVFGGERKVACHALSIMYMHGKEANVSAALKGWFRGMNVVVRAEAPLTEYTSQSIFVLCNSGSVSEFIADQLGRLDGVLTCDWLPCKAWQPGEDLCTMLTLLVPVESIDPITKFPECLLFRRRGVQWIKLPQDGEVRKMRGISIWHLASHTEAVRTLVMSLVHERHIGAQLLIGASDVAAQLVTYIDWDEKDLHALRQKIINRLGITFACDVVEETELDRDMRYLESAVSILVSTGDFSAFFPGLHSYYRMIEIKSARFGRDHSKLRAG